MKRIAAALFATTTILFASVAIGQQNADDYMKFWRPAVGNWETIRTVDGQVTEKGQVTVRPSRTEKCLVAMSTIDGKVAEESIHGFDPGKSCWQIVAFGADGSHTTTMVRIDLNQFPRLTAGIHGEIETVSVSADGTVVKSSSTIKCTDCKRERIAYHFSDRVEDAASQPDMQIVIERLARE